MSYNDTWGVHLVVNVDKESIYTCYTVNDDCGKISSQFNITKIQKNIIEFHSHIKMIVVKLTDSLILHKNLS